jgi:beta-lactam-binding protein with PASTA domain/tRNA A-37 threonylcarbamoyl transferase component Bud32
MLGRLIDGRYQVRSRIARGGMATVYLATDLRLERRVALKVMHGHLADDNTFRNRFVQEARSAARLAHPNVVNVFDQGQDADMAYLVMEYLPGITLRDLIKDYGRLTPEQTMDILAAVLSGLAAAHKAGILHRDLKPENVLLADDGRIKIGDFGLARAASNNTATGQALLGTIAYLSPELVTRGIADTRSDIYALGIMTYEMLTGEQPYIGEAPMQIAYQHANDSVPMPSSRVPGIPHELDDLVLWATARDPEKRPRDARVMLDRLQEVETQVRTPAATMALAHTMVLAGPQEDSSADAATQLFETRALVSTERTAPDSSTALRERSQKRKRRGYWLFTLVILLAALSGGTGWYFGAGPGSQVALPGVVGDTPEVASAKLTDLGFDVAVEERNDPDVATGLITGSDPDGGFAPKGSTVTLFVSVGPQMLPVPAVVGIPEAEARDLLGSFTVGDSIREFSSGAPAENVLAVFGADGAQLGTEYGEKQPVTLLVSAGPIPNVTGLSVDAAQEKLSSVGLSGVPGETEFSDVVEKGLVIAAEPQTDPVRVNDTVSLRISQGPDVVEVPNVLTGQTIAAARAQLEDLGFQVQSNVPTFLEGAVVAGAQDPEPGTFVKRGSTISVNFGS